MFRLVRSWRVVADERFTRKMSYIRSKSSRMYRLVLVVENRGMAERVSAQLPSPTQSASIHHNQYNWLY